MKLILDTSKYEDNLATPETINWQTAKDAGVSAVIMKATGTYRTNNYIDKAYQLHSKNCKGILPRGSYHFFDTNDQPLDQAKFYWNQIKNSNEEIAPALDIEGYPYGTLARGSSLINQMTIFLDEISQRSGRLPIIYCNQDMIRNCMQIKGKKNHPFTKYPLWFSWPQKTAPTKEDFDPWSECTLWQFSYTGDAHKYGIFEATAVDENYFMLSDDKFELFINSSHIPDPVIPDPVASDGLEFTTLYQMHIRSEPSIFGKDLGLIEPGTKIAAIGIGGDDAWIMIGENMWVCNSRKGNTYLK